MKNLILLIAIFIIPGLASAESLFSCDAEEFYADSTGELTRDKITSPRVVIEIKMDGSEMAANFEVMKAPPIKVSGAPVKMNKITPESVGTSVYNKAVGYIALMLGQKSVADSTAYRSYKVLKKNGSVYMAAFEILSGDQVIARAIFWPGLEIVGICKP